MPIETMSAADARQIMAGHKAPGLTPGAFPSPVRTPQAPSLESLFAALWDAHGNNEKPVAEYAFFEGRKWRFDWAFPAHLVAIECDGIIKQAGGGRHNTDADRDKLNHACAAGWRILRFSRAQLTDQPEHCAALVRRALGEEK